MGKIILGVGLLILQIISYVGNLASGGVKFFSEFSIYEVAYFIGFNLIGIIGLIVLIFGLISLRHPKPEEDEEEEE